MKLIIEVNFAVDAMTDRRQQEIQQLVQDLKTDLEPYGGKVIRVELRKE